MPACFAPVNLRRSHLPFSGLKRRRLSVWQCRDTTASEPAKAAINQSEPASAPPGLLTFVKVAAVSVAAYGIVCAPAHAEPRVWKPRRHHRHLGERYGSRWAEPIAKHMLEAETAATEEARAAAKAARAADQQRLEQLRQQREARRQEKLRALEDKRRAEEVERKKKEIVQQIVSLPQRIGTFVSDYIGILNLAIFLLLLAALGKWLVNVLIAPLWTFVTGAPFRFSTRGRWIYDRSLGGKRVWLPDSDETVQTTQRTPSTLPALKDEDFDNLTRIAAAAAPTSSATVPQCTVPTWWQEASSLPQPTVSSVQQAAKQEEANLILKGLEAAKVAGRDWSLEDLLRLHAVCKAGQVSVQPSTEEKAKAMYRTAVEGTLQGVMDGNVLIGDEPPGQLLHGLARELGLPDDKAIMTLRSTVAKIFRASILQVVASIRQKNDNDCLVQLLRLASLSTTLPVLMRGDPEVELVASSLRKCGTHEQRQKIFEIYGQIDPSEGTAVVAEIMGFDPNQAIKQLAVHLQKQRAKQDPSQSDMP